MNRIYLPYPIEIIIKVLSWVIAIVIDTIKLILKPIMMIGLRCSLIFVILSAIFCGYVHFSCSVTIGQSFLMFGALIALFVVFLITVRLIGFVLTKASCFLFANVIFAPVAISFTIPSIRKCRKKQ